MHYPAEQFKTSRQQLIELLAAGHNTKSFPDAHTALTDQYFQDSIREIPLGRSLQQQRLPFALVAMGGYGRRELCLHSDIDILLLFETKVPVEAKTLVEETLFPLWDMGLDLGYGTRTIKDCISMTKKDFEVLTSLLDARFIAGEYSLYLALIEKLYKKVISKKARSLQQWLIEQDKKRLATFGDSSYLLEPDLKEGIGGLRDYHHMLWLAKASFGPRETHDRVFRARHSYQEYQELQQHVNFLLDTRNLLHLLSHRRNDRLTFEYQEVIAQRLGLRDNKASLAVEQFNSLVHATMASLKSLSNHFIADLFFETKKIRKRKQIPGAPRGLYLVKEELGFDSSRVILHDPSLLMAIFESSARLGHPLSPEARRQVREFLYLVDDSFRRLETIVSSFIRIVTNSTHTFETLNHMMDVGLLDSFIPEFGLIRNRVEFDAYHIYPVGMHSLQTIKYINSLTEEKDIFLRDLFVELQHPEQLFLASLFHDIGKIGSDHARRGAKIAKNILKRFGLPDDAIEDICFLVRFHLLLVETATRRDLNDEKVIVQCARQIGSLERLKLLYLLTWADSRATGPTAWNDWIASLIRDLFFKILHILEKGELASHDATRKVDRIKSEVRKHIATDTYNVDLEASFEQMSPRYLLNTSPQQVLQHLGMVQRLKAGLHVNKKISGEEAFIFETKKEEVKNCWEITIVTKDRPGLFTNIVGVLTFNAINILSADIYTWRDGAAVDVLRTTNPLDDLFAQEKWDKVQDDLTNVLTGRLSVEHTISNEETTLNSSSVKKIPQKPIVAVDNESSDFFTLIEVYSYDRVGVLYRITHALFDLGLDIHSARIATKVDQIVDVFYVRDLEGQKIEDEKMTKKIRRVLLQKLKHL